MNLELFTSKVSNFFQIIFKPFYWYLEALYRQIIPPPKQSIDGETILVTGAAGGIGKEICKNLLLSGANIKLVLWDVDISSLQKLATELELIGDGMGHKIYPFEVDISTRENIEMASKKVIENVGPISILFNNAGIFRTGNVLLQSNDDIEKTIQVNFMSHIWIIRQFLPNMVLQNHGRIVNICSMTGIMAAPKIAAYSASKFAVNGYSEALRMELEEFGHDGIHLSMVYPYFAKTPLVKSLEVKESDDKLFNYFFSFLEPEDIGKAIVDGMMRELESIYLPRLHFLSIVLTDYLIPTKAKKALRERFYSGWSFTGDEAEQERLTTSFCDVINAGEIDPCSNGNTYPK